MIAYILRRILMAIPLLLGISFVTFMFIHLAPGNYFDTLRMNPQISEDIIAQYEATYHLDRPAIVQYGYWLRNLLRGDLGYSFAFRSPVVNVIGSRLGNTLLLAFVAMLITWMVAIPLGIMGALRSQTLWDRLISFVAFMGLAVPNFFLALLLLYGTSVTGWLPTGGMRSVGLSDAAPWVQWWDVARHLVIPAVVISTAAWAGLQRIMRGNMLEVLRAPYITTARAKGLSEGRVIYRHALRNAINPMITIFGYELSALLSGAALTEIICNWPGLGSLMLAAVRQQDMFLVMGSMMMGGVLLLAGNLIADILLAWSDPRIRYD